MLLGAALALDEAQLYARSNDAVDQRAASRYRQLVTRRAAREPAAYLLCEREFYGRRFAVDRRVLIPRPETEQLVEQTLQAVTPTSQVLDLGTGSGCIAVTIAAERPRTRVVATDVSLAALAVADANCRRHGVERRVQLVAADLLSASVVTRFDVVVSNPPYVAATERGSLMPEVRDHEPACALFAGDGLDIYRRLFAACDELTSGQTLLLEIGAGQLEAVTALGARGGFAVEATTFDLASIPRVLQFRRSSSRRRRPRTSP